MDLLEMEEEYLASTYGRQPITLVEGDGIKVKDSEGKEYLDFVAGLAVCSLGHSHPEIQKTLNEQAGKLVHTSNLYHIAPQAELAKKLAEVTPEGIQKFFFCNSGTEAVEAALKLAIKHTGRDKVVALNKSFHGRTAGSLSVTWKEKYRKPFKNFVPSIGEFSPLNDLDEAREKIDEKTAAVIAEPVQGEGGVNILSREFISGLRQICDEAGALLAFDEVQAGICRTGEWFACEHFDVEPDIITMAKALGNGFPIGAMGAREEVMDSFSSGDHASTFGGNPLACSVGKTVIETMEEENIPSHVREVGNYFRTELQDLAAEHSELIEEVRGLGLMLAVELRSESVAKEAVSKAREDGFLINRTAKSVLRFVPPLIVRKDHVDQLIKELEHIFDEVE